MHIHLFLTVFVIFFYWNKGESSDKKDFSQKEFGVFHVNGTKGLDNLLDILGQENPMLKKSYENTILRNKSKDLIDNYVENKNIGKLENFCVYLSNDMTLEVYSSCQNLSVPLTNFSCNTNELENDFQELVVFTDSLLHDNFVLTNGIKKTLSEDFQRKINYNSILLYEDPIQEKGLYVGKIQKINKKKKVKKILLSEFCEEEKNGKDILETTHHYLVLKNIYRHLQQATFQESINFPQKKNESTNDNRWTDNKETWRSILNAQNEFFKLNLSDLSTEFLMEILFFTKEKKKKYKSTFNKKMFCLPGIDKKFLTAAQQIEEKTHKQGIYFTVYQETKKLTSENLINKIHSNVSLARFYYIISHIKLAIPSETLRISKDVKEKATEMLKQEKKISENLKKNNLELQKEKNDSQQRLEVIEKKLQDTENANKNFQNELMLLEQKLKKYQEINNVNENLKKKDQEYQNENKKLQETNKKLELTFQEFREKTQKQNEEKIQKQKRLDEEKQNLETQLKLQKGSLLQNTQKHSKEVQEMKSKLNNLEKEKETLETEIKEGSKKLQESEKHSQERIKKLTQEIEEGKILYEKEKKLFQENTEKLTQEIKNCEELYENEKNKTVLLEKEIENKSQEKRKIITIKNNNQHFKLTQEIEKLRKENENLRLSEKLQIETLKKEIMELTEKTKEQKRLTEKPRFTFVKRENILKKDNKEDQINSLTQEIEILKKINSEEKEKLKIEFEKENEILKQKIDEIKLEKNKYYNLYIERLEKNVTLNDRNTNLSNENNDLKYQIDCLLFQLNQSNTYQYDHQYYSYGHHNNTDFSQNNNNYQGDK